MEETVSVLDYLNGELNMVLMIAFILVYSGLIWFNSSQTKFANFSRNLVYMASGVLFTYYVFQISYLQPYEEFQYLVAFLLALSFRDLLPVLVNFTVDICTVKLKQLDDKIRGDTQKKQGRK